MNSENKKWDFKYSPLCVLVHLLHSSLLKDVNCSYIFDFISTAAFAKLFLKHFLSVFILDHWTCGSCFHGFFEFVDKALSILCFVCVFVCVSLTPLLSWQHTALCTCYLLLCLQATEIWGNYSATGGASTAICVSNVLLRAPLIPRILHHGVSHKTYYLFWMLIFHGLTPEEGIWFRACTVDWCLLFLTMCFGL